MLSSTLCSTLVASAITLATLGFAAPVLAANPTQARAFGQVDSAGGLSQLIRSNSVHYWSFMKSAQLDSIATYMPYEGVIAGDPHMGNFSVLPLTSIDGHRQMKFINIDFDDAGRGPFVLDFIRFVISAEATNDEVKKKALERAYLMGLNGEEIEPPGTVREFLQMGVESYDQMLDRYVDKKTTGDQFKIKPGKVEVYDGKITTAILAKLLPGVKILDIARRPKERGGSMSSLRLWILGENEAGRRRIYELKQHSKSGLSAYAPQPPLGKWLNEIREVFWPGADPSSYDLVDVPGSGLFWLREKRKALLDIPYSSEKLKKIVFIKELAVYDANILGLAHGRQATAKEYRLAIESNPAVFHEAIEPIVDEYLESAKRALSAAGSTSTAAEGADDEGDD